MFMFSSDFERKIWICQKFFVLLCALTILQSFICRDIQAFCLTYTMRSTRILGTTMSSVAGASLANVV